MAPTVRLATRGSPLARRQAELVAQRIAGAVELVIVKTGGDRQPGRAIAEIGGQGVFVKEVQEAVLDGRADAAVHSAKDLPSGPAPGLRIVAVPERADPRDALVGARLGDLAPGALVATGAARRRAQLAALRPDLAFTDLRGNIATRLARADSTTTVVVAMAALQRLGLEGRATEVLSCAQMVPQAGQGALAVECRADDEEMCERVGAIDEEVARRELEAERSFLHELGGGCQAPVGALARALRGSAVVELTGLVARLDGRVALRVTRSGPEPEELGRCVARALIDEHGGAALLPGLA